MNLKKEDVLIQIRDKLRIDRIKLWIDPYYSEKDGPCLEDLQKLARVYTEALKVEYALCYESLLELQNNSLENLKQRARFSESGLATLKIKVLYPKNSPKMLTKELMLSMRTCDLVEMMGPDLQQDSISLDRLKLISSGKVLNENDSLSKQGVKNGSMILAIVLLETSAEAQESETEMKELETTKTDSRLLALDNKYMQLEDQFGNIVKVPSQEKKALIVAMTLQEKGKTALRKENYSKALIYFLEADEEYRRCNSKLLNLVDNYALLDLDIAWCYLCLQSVVNLPEAYDRLKNCEERFYKSYGTNLERLIAVKGSTGNEGALLMRLHLLQSITLYHQNKRDQALALLQKTEKELLDLKVDENSVISLLELGYTSAEARIGLRAAQGDINRAANYINESREKRVEARKKALADELLQKERTKLGKCVDGKQYVEPNFLNILVNMGYNKEIARVALRQTNNIISDSIQYIQENPLPGPSGTRSQEMLKLVEDKIPELVEAGFDNRMAKLALRKNMGDIVKAAEELLENDGIIQGDLSQLEGNFQANSQQISNALLLCAEADRQVIENIKKTSQEKSEAFGRLAQDINVEDDDHLDLTLQQEEVFLYQYMSLLKK